MIQNVASHIVELLVKNQIIEFDQIDTYQYGFEIFFSSLITCLITLLCGIVFQCFIASIIYFVLFALLRTICGGYHAKTYLHCNLIFTFVTIFVILLYKYVSLEQFAEMHYCSIFLSVIMTLYYAPIENKNKPLTICQKKFFRILGTALVVLLALISCLLKIKYSSQYSILVDATLLVVSISMFITEPMRGGE